MDVLRKMLELGNGMYSLGKESVDVLTKDLMREYELQEPVARRMAKDLITHSIESQKKILNLVENHVEKVLSGKPSARKAAPVKKRKK